MVATWTTHSEMIEYGYGSVSSKHWPADPGMHVGRRGGGAGERGGDGGEGRGGEGVRRGEGEGGGVGQSAEDEHSARSEDLADVPIGGEGEGGDGESFMTFGGGGG